MRVGLIGAGRIGARHIETLRELPSVESVVVADADRDRAAQVAALQGVAAAESVEALLAGRPDGVVICAPTPAHPELVRSAARAGIPVFCEKPLAPDAEGTRELIAAVGEVPLQLGFQRRFDAEFGAARDRLANGELGRLQTVVACTLDPAPPDPAYLPTSGGIFRDCSVHDIDAVRWATGREIVEVYAVGSDRAAPFFAEADDIDTGQAILTLDDGTPVSMLASRYNGHGYDARLELHGSRDTATAGVEGVRDVAYPGFAERFAEAYAAELATFVEVAAGRMPSPCRGEDALAALLVADACELSRRKHRPVRLEEVA